MLGLTLSIISMLGCQINVVNLSSIQADLVTPPASDGVPRPGFRVVQVDKSYASTKVHHLLYLPVDWKAGGKYPVIVEYAGNQWKSCPGTVEGSNLGYGISGGKGFIWVCMPFVDSVKKMNALTWWGDVSATVNYCKRVVRTICEEYGGDPEAVFLAGFSRGAIACNYIGLHDADVARLWRGFICHSHYDGVKEWPYPGSDKLAAAKRLERLGDRPQFISHEASIRATRLYLKKAFRNGNFTFQRLPFSDHTDAWVLRNIPERRALRRWMAELLSRS